MEASLDFIILTRFFAAILLGAAIGLERELTNKYAGLRTHILVCFGSCIFTLLSIYAFPLAADNIHPQAFGDPARIAAQVLTGIGFIGGGTVLRHGSSVYGLTTAATLWVSASIGMACGSGMLVLATTATIASVAILVLIRIFEQKVLSNRTKAYCQLDVTVVCKSETAENIHDFILNKLDHVLKISKTRTENNNDIKINAVLCTSGKHNIQSLYNALNNLEGIEDISIQENNE